MNFCYRTLADPDSIFYYYKKLISLRKENPVVVYGNYDLIFDSHEEVYAFTHTLQKDRLLVILNFTRNTPVFALPSHIRFADKELLLSNLAVDQAGYPPADPAAFRSPGLPAPVKIMVRSSPSGYE